MERCNEGRNIHSLNLIIIRCVYLLKVKLIRAIEVIFDDGHMKLKLRNAFPNEKITVLS